MKKSRLFFTSLILFSGLSVDAQRPYSVVATTETYQALTSTTTMNNKVIWDDENFSVPMPFRFKIGSVTTNKFHLGLILLHLSTDTGNRANAFILLDADLTDRGLLKGSASLSPIRYLTTGTAPNRIFKVELANAGFYNEYDAYNSMDDYLNMQVWCYETSNILEVRYGAAQITNPGGYFNFGNGPFMAYVQNIDLEKGSWDLLYAVNGNPANPCLDEVGSGASMLPILNTMPANGTVYRFIPRSSQWVSNFAAFKNVAVYPTYCNDVLQVNFRETGIADYMIIATDGRIMSNAGKLGNGINSIDIQRLARGHYLMVVHNKEGRGSYPFIKM